MPEISLTRGKVAFADAADMDLLSNYKWSFNGRYAQAVDRQSGKVVKMHRVIMQPPANLEVDHINGNMLDNRRANLRLATRRQNARNRRLSKDNTSGYKGAQWHAQLGRWQGRIKVNGKFISLGVFDTAEAAGRAYDDAARTYFGEFAHPNFPAAG